MKKTTQFRHLLNDNKISIMPSVHDPLCAKLAVDAGVELICCSGYANSAAFLGAGDASLMSSSEMVSCLSRIVDAANCPVFADADTGYGGIPNVIRTIKLFEKAGAAGLFIEDQTFPKRCGHMQGKSIISKEEMVCKVKAAVDTRQDQDFVIMARCDAIALEGFEAAIERANAYVEAGADAIFIEAPESVEQLEAIPSLVPEGVYLMANMIPQGITPILPADRLEALGYHIAAYPTDNSRIIAKVIGDYMESLVKNRNNSEFEHLMMGFEEFKSKVGLTQLWEKEKMYMK
ncbi:isocitrate lyase/PEP mutase family protein [Francisella sp. 19X1-34]|uniref:isocitrate lyase/PEP mutase family protein n=1 Tax=Francisella sp. 19X1-34 TaxID=3087177 RepID=UPI002E31F51F|nr:isocitrate lyase/PEP mutase family protein [Francisella sp. 19X1-34]MED7788749.1 isocitrate lyase/PEP mutase family protein [Francisella sp. 19X1-34]